MLGRMNGATDVSSLLREIEALKAKEREATIVKRVSQQMEDIAYQQKEVSDRQRERAEEQSALAISERERAEMESDAARSAEAKAVLALADAEQQRSIAEQQSAIAIQQRDEAQLAKSISDTLNYRAHGRTLGNSSRTKYEAGNTEQAQLLAYASWYFLDRYKGNTYLEESFKAVQNATHSLQQFSVPKFSSVNATTFIPETDECLVATDYGEIFLLHSTEKGITSRVLLNDKTFDFRDVLVVNKSIYALSYNGYLCRLTLSGNVENIPVGGDGFSRVISLGNGTLLLVARDRVEWFDVEKTRVTAIKQLPSTVSSVCQCDDVTELYFTDNTRYQLLADRTLRKSKPQLEGLITCCYYDKQEKSIYLGRSDGLIRIIPRHRKYTDLVAHSSAINSMALMDSILLTASYDQTFCVWNLPRLLHPLEENVNLVDQKKVTPREWLLPVTYKCKGWPKSVVFDSKNRTAWIGASNGFVQHMSVSADGMADRLLRQLKRNFTIEEWNEFLGVTIPYVKFK